MLEEQRKRGCWSWTRLNKKVSEIKWSNGKLSHREIRSKLTVQLRSEMASESQVCKNKKLGGAGRSHVSDWKDSLFGWHTMRHTGVTKTNNEEAHVPTRRRQESESCGKRVLANKDL